MASLNRITELANQIAADTAVVNNYSETNGLPTPSFDVNGPPVLAIPPSEKEVISAKDRVVAYTLELHNLMRGPVESVVGTSIISFNESLSLQAIIRFQVPEALDLDEKASFETLSERTGVNVTELRRLVRHAMTYWVFREEDGIVVHTAASRALRENAMARAVSTIMLEEIFQGASRSVDALDKYNYFTEPGQSGWAWGHNEPKGLYAGLRQYPDRAERFAKAMDGFAARTPVDPTAKGFDWATNAAKEATVVDVGGGWGPVSIGLAERFPGIKFIVQDFADIIAEGPSHVPPQLKDRIEFMESDFLVEQPVCGADIYFMRAVLHNWVDDYCLKILRSLIPALKRDARIVISDAIMWEPWTLPPYTEKFRRSMDLNMMTLFGSRERSLDEWKQLFQTADSRFVLEYVYRENTSMMVLVWDSESKGV
ncbi:MAG: hypothetical protein Q9227_009074 [Pyrenula ochraceoflavens]